MNQQGTLFAAIFFTIVVIVVAVAVEIFGSEKLVNIVRWSLIDAILATIILTGLAALWLYGLGIIAV